MMYKLRENGFTWTCLHNRVYTANVGGVVVKITRLGTAAMLDGRTVSQRHTSG
jgi:hypothetical protein